MAKEIPIDPNHHKSGLYDRVAEKSCVTEKVVDITEDCPLANETERAILLFTRDKSGRICQICRPYEGQVYTGTKIHFFVDELDTEMNMPECDDTFGSRAEMLGLTKLQLRQLIEANAPA